jgi:hypothetical protein
LSLTHPTNHCLADELLEHEQCYSKIDSVASQSNTSRLQQAQCNEGDGCGLELTVPLIDVDDLIDNCVDSAGVRRNECAVQPESHRKEDDP